MDQREYDVISAGEDDPPRRSGRAKRRAAAVGVAALVAVTCWQLTRHGGTPAAVHLPGPAPSAAASSFSGTPDAALLLPSDDTLPMGEATGAQLVLAGPALVDIALDSGAVTTTALPGRTAEAVRVRGGDVLLVSDVATGARTAVFAPDGRADTVDLGPASAVIPAADDQHVWLAGAVQAALLRKVRLTGLVVARADLGPWRVAVRETAYGMVTTSTKYFSNLLELWNLADRRVDATFWVAANLIVIAADAEHVAFVLPYCDLRLCPVKLADLRTGEIADLPMPVRWEPNAAAFSPDGTRLAVLGRQLGRDVEENLALVVVDVRSRAATTVAGVEVLTSRSTLLTWSADSRWFFAAAGPAIAPLLGYRLGDRSVRYAPFPRLARGVDPKELISLTAH